MRCPRGPRALAALARALAPPRCWRPAAFFSSLFRGSCGFDFFPFHSYQTKIKCFRRQKLFEDILGPLDFWFWKCSYWPGYVRVQPCTHAPMHSSAVAGDRQLWSDLLWGGCSCTGACGSAPLRSSASVGVLQVHSPEAPRFSSFVRGFLCQHL